MLAYTLRVSPLHFLSLPLTPSHPPPSLTESFEPPHQTHLSPSTLPSSSRPLPFQHKKRWTHGLLATTTGRYASQPVISACVFGGESFFRFSFFVFFFLSTQKDARLVLRTSTGCRARWQHRPKQAYPYPCPIGLLAHLRLATLASATSCIKFYSGMCPQTLTDHRSRQRPIRLLLPRRRPPRPCSHHADAPHNPLPMNLTTISSIRSLTERQPDYAMRLPCTTLC